MKQTVRHGLGIALSAMAFVCNYSPWVRNAAALPDALTLSWDWVAPEGFVLDHFKVRRGGP